MLLNSRYSSFIGQYAFSIYIMQVFCLHLFKEYIWKWSFIIKYNPYLMIALSLFISIVVGILTYHFVEKPAANFLKRKFG